MMTIGTPTKDDYDQISVIFNELHRQHIAYNPDIFRPVTNLISQQKFNEMVDKDEIFACREGNLVTGYLLATIKESKTHGYSDRKSFCIKEFAVKQGHQGKGIGRELINFAIRKAKSLKCKDIELSVNPENKGAIGFYEKVGMKVKNIKYMMKV